MSYVIIAYIVYALFGAEYGMINNSILKPLGMMPVSWYTEDKHWPIILTCVSLWKLLWVQQHHLLCHPCGL